ncbi:MAG: hypothetical protein JJ975_08000 [Bacteroidia bacterium]|nr:hypothetical protein [Bacteroidia bacterium]
MSEKDLDIIKKVIEEEGMRRDIGLLIDESLHSGASTSWFSTHKWKLFVSGIIVAGIAVLLYLSLPKANQSQQSQVSEERGSGFRENQSEIKSEQEAEQNTSETYAYDKAVSDRTNTQPNEAAMNSKSDLGNQKETPNSTTNQQPPVKRANNKPNQVTSTNNDGEGEETDTKEQETSEDSPSQASTDTSDNSDQNQLVDTTETESDSTNGPTTQQSDTLAHNTTPGDTSVSKADSTGNSANGQTRPNTIQKRWRVSAAPGYAFVSTGDVRNLEFAGGIDFKVNPHITTGLQASYGISYQAVELVKASFFQTNLMGFYSPFQNTKRHDVRAGAGASLYQIDHRYRGSSQIIGGVPVFEYVDERRKAIGYRIQFDYCYYITPRLCVGAAFYTNQYTNEDAISGVQTQIGITF